MKKTFKIFLSVLASALLTVSVLCFKASAIGSTIALSGKSVTVGDSVTVTVTVNPEEAIYAVSCIINYDASVFEYTGGNAQGGAGSLRIVESPSGETKVSYPLTFKALSAGSGTFAVADVSYATMYEDKTTSGASASVTVNNAALSSNANLSALSLSSGSLSPRFSASRTSYSVTVPNSVADISVFATAADPAAKVEVPASTKLNIGKNSISVVVTAASGAQKIYKINVTRSETEEIDSTEPTPDETPTEINVLEPVIDGAKYTVATDISAIPLFSGFTAQTVDFKGTPVQVAQDKDKNFTLYYLKDAESDTYYPYTFDSENDTFLKLPYIIQGNNYYIICDIPSNKAYTDVFYATSATIAGFEVSCLAYDAPDFSDYYYLYCFSNGEYGTYSYDIRENTIQRSPELVLYDAAEFKKTNEDTNIIERFMSMPLAPRAVVVCLILLGLGCVVLLVLLIIRLFSARKIDFEDEPEPDFSNITFTDEQSESDKGIDFSDNIKVNVVENPNDNGENMN